MGAAIIVPIYLFLVVLFGALGIAWYRRANRRRLTAIGASLANQGARVAPTEHAGIAFGSTRLSFEIDGRSGHVTNRWWARGMSRISFDIRGAKRPGMWIRRPVPGVSALSVLLGLAKARTIAGTEVTIATLASDATIDRLLASENAQRILVELLTSTAFGDVWGRGTNVTLSPTGLGLVKFTNAWWELNPRIAAPILRKLEELDAALPAIDERAATPLRDSHPLAPSIFLPLVALGLCIPMTMLVTFPMAIAHVQEMILLGLLPVPLLAWALLRRYRGRPNGLREWVAAALAVLAATPFFVAALLAAANTGFDSSKPTRHHVKMLDYYKGNTHTVWVDSWEPGVTHEKVIVPRTIATVSPGDWLDVTTKDGAFGWPWTVAVEKE